jgi:hypothetical protein
MLENRAMSSSKMDPQKNGMSYCCMTDFHPLSWYDGDDDVFQMLQALHQCICLMM